MPDRHALGGAVPWAEPARRADWHRHALNTDPETLRALARQAEMDQVARQSRMQEQALQHALRLDLAEPVAGRQPEGRAQAYRPSTCRPT